MMQGESGHGVGAGFDGDSGAVEQAGEFHDLGPGFHIDFIFAWGWAHALGKEAAANLRGQAAGDGPVSAGNFAGAAEVFVFEDAEGEVELGVVILQ